MDLGLYKMLAKIYNAGDLYTHRYSYVDTW